MSSPRDRTSPDWAGPARDTNWALGAKPSLIPITDPLDELATHVDGAFVVIVHLTSGRHRRRCFLTIAAAERHARRAQEAGHGAEVFLAELKPLWKVIGREVAS